MYSNHYKNTPEKKMQDYINKSYIERTPIIDSKKESFLSSDRKTQMLLQNEDNKKIFIQEVKDIISGKLKLSDCHDFTQTNNTANIAALIMDYENAKETIKNVRSNTEKNNYESIISMIGYLLEKDKTNVGVVTIMKNIQEYLDNGKIKVGKDPHSCLVRRIVIEKGYPSQKVSTDAERE